MIDLEHIGARIKELRLERGLTQSEFAQTLSVSFQAVSNWERGIAPPELDNLIKIASFFGVLVDDLLTKKAETLYLGVDGGGTKTEFCLVNESGYTVARTVKGGTNPNDIGFSKTEEILINGINELLLLHPSIAFAHLGIAGTSSGNYSEMLKTSLKKHFKNIKISVKNDASNLFAFDESCDMAIISGTGSVAFVKNGDECIRLGGWGNLFDEAGSAYDIGRDAVRRALFEEDNRLPSSTLSKKLYEKMGTKTAWENIKKLYAEGKPYIASLAPIVFDAYTERDSEAAHIIEKNAKALAELLSAGVQLYGAKQTAIASGGIFEHYSDILLEYIRKYTRVKLIICDLPPVYGACRMAVALDKNIRNDFYDNFKLSYGGIK